jgi:hypothetical protein
LKTKLLTGFIIFGLLLSSSSVYLKVAFADDNWSDIAKRQQAAEQRAQTTYQDKYQFTDMNNTKRNWSGLTSTETNSTTGGRNIDAQAKVSLENALAQFDKIHVQQLSKLQANGYQGLTNTPTDTQGRDRNTMISEAQSISVNLAEKTVTDLAKIQARYANFFPGETTDMTTYDRQAGLEKTQINQETKAAELVNPLATIDTAYVNIDQYTEGTKFVYQSGSVTNMKSNDAPLAIAKAQALEKAIKLFNEIHSKHLHELQTPTYGGVMGSYSGSWYQNYDAEKAIGETSIQKSQSEISNYYQSQGLK